MPGNFSFAASKDLQRGLVEQVRSTDVELSDPKPWTPGISSTGAGFSLGPGSSFGLYVRRQGIVDAWFSFKFAGTSFGAAGGLFALVTPWNHWPQAFVTNTEVGSWWGFDESVGTYGGGPLFSIDAATGSVSNAFWFSNNASSSPISTSVPWTWANSDRLSGHLSYPVQPGY